MPTYKECPFESDEGVVCKEVVTSQGMYGHLRGHLKGHEDEVAEIDRYMKLAIETDPPKEEKPKDPSLQTVASDEGRTPPPPEGEALGPPLPEEQMVEEMVACLETELKYLPKFRRDSIKYLLDRFKEEPALQEDANQLFRILQLSSPQSNAEFIAATVDKVFTIRQKYNIDRMRMLRAYPTLQSAQGASPIINPNPFPPLQTSTAPHPWDLQPTHPQTYPPQGVQNPEVKKLVDEVKELKTEIGKKEEKSKWEQLLEEQKKASQILVDELKKEREKTEQKHKEDIGELKKLIETGKEKDKFREFEGQVGAINSKLDSSLAGVKEMLTEYMFEDKKKEHARDVEDLKKKIEDVSQKKETEDDFFDRMEKYEGRIESFAKRRGLTQSGNKSMKDEALGKIANIIDKASESVLTEKPDKVYDPPPNKEFTPITSTTRKQLHDEAARKVQQEHDQTATELKKIAAENQALRDIEDKLTAEEKAKKKSEAEKAKKEEAEALKEEPTPVEEPVPREPAPTEEPAPPEEPASKEPPKEIPPQKKEPAKPKKPIKKVAKKRK